MLLGSDLHHVSRHVVVVDFSAVEATRGFREVHSGSLVTFNDPADDLSGRMRVGKRDLASAGKGNTAGTLRNTCE
ncbi:hypothetical protein D9M68_933080 [compost metagenome]